MTREERAKISLRSRNKHKKAIAERVREKRIEKLTNDYEGYMLENAIRNSKRTGREVTITREDIIVPDTCPVLGIPLNKFCTREDRDSAPSLDRIDNTLGYVPGNVIVVSMRANQLKGTATVEELEKVVIFYKELLDK